MSADDSTLLTFGISISLVLFAGGLVKNTIDRLKGAFGLDARHCVALSYVLSTMIVLLLELMAIKTVPALSPTSFLSFVGFLCNVGITGLLTGNYAGMLTDTHDKAREDKASTT